MFLKNPGENPGIHRGETPWEFNQRFFAQLYCPSREICAGLSSAALSHNCMHTFMDEKVRWDGDKNMRNYGTIYDALHITAKGL